jgi:hypothetical protein
MNDQEEQMGEIIVTTNKNKFKELPLLSRRLFENSGANAGIENILKTLPGVNL